jgi:NAD(P)-dependent dehydrogenase (short-subunit alcohol dehydrogenase family)
MFTFNLARDLAGSNVGVNALHPATLMNTKMVYEGWGSTMSTVDEGGAAVVYLATSPDLEDLMGQYFEDDKPARPIPCL